jgi:hypothetical protein
MLPMRRLLGLALLLAVPTASAGAASAPAQADMGIVTAAHPALRGSISRRLPHPTVAPTTNEVSEARCVGQSTPPAGLTRCPKSKH